MNQIKKACLLLGILFIFPVWVSAEKLSLEDLYLKALKNREIIKSYEISKDQAKLSIDAKKGDYLPSLDAGYKANKLDESSLFENEKNSEISLALTQNLFHGFKDKTELEIAKLDLKSSDYDLVSVKQDISMQAAIAVLGVYQANAKRVVAEDAYKAYSERYENTKLKYSVGVAKKRDLLVMKVEKDDAAQSLIQAENDVQKSLNVLKRIIGEEITIENIDFSLFNNLPVFKAFEEYKSVMLMERNDVKKLKTGLKKAKQSETLAKAAYYPKVDLVFSQRYYSDEYNAFDSDTKEDETRIQLNLGINLFDGMKKYKNIDKARLEQQRVEYGLDELETELATALENYLLDAKTAEKNLYVANEGIKEAEENLRITELSFDKGVATATDVLDSIYYLSRARNNSINAKANVFATWFQIKRLIVGYPK